METTNRYMQDDNPGRPFCGNFILFLTLSRGRFRIWLPALGRVGKV
jgi:hypothetical protein